jgi:hypothetical protein
MFVDSELAKARRRPIEANHERLIETQILDALLRIEETLIKYGQAFYKVDEEGSVSEVPLEDVIVDVRPQETPFQKALAAKPKGSRGKVDRL